MCFRISSLLTKRVISPVSHPGQTAATLSCTEYLSDRWQRQWVAFVTLCDAAPGLFIQISKELGRKRPPSLKTVGREYLTDLSIPSTPKLEMRRNLWRPGSFKGLRVGGKVGRFWFVNIKCRMLIHLGPDCKWSDHEGIVIVFSFKVRDWWGWWPRPCGPAQSCTVESERTSWERLGTNSLLDEVEELLLV